MKEQNELWVAIREEREAEKRLAECRRRVNELCGLISDTQQRKSTRQTPSRELFRKGCLL